MSVRMTPPITFHTSFFSDLMGLDESEEHSTFDATDDAISSRLHENAEQSDILHRHVCVHYMYWCN